MVFTLIGIVKINTQLTLEPQRRILITLVTIWRRIRLHNKILYIPSNGVACKRGVSWIEHADVHEKMFYKILGVVKTFLKVLHLFKWTTERIDALIVFKRHNWQLNCSSFILRWKLTVFVGSLIVAVYRIYKRDIAFQYFNYNYLVLL